MKEKLEDSYAPYARFVTIEDKKVQENIKSIDELMNEVTVLKSKIPK